MKKQLLTAAFLTTAISVGVFGVTQAQASHVAVSNDSLIQKLATRFNVSEEDVKKVFTEDRTEKMAAMEKKFEAELTQAVQNGSLTENQKQLILSKRKELAVENKDHESFEGKSPEEMRSMMDAKRQEIDAWAKENGIDSKYLMPRMKLKGKGPMQVSQP
jgi:hypothetical protein